MTTLASAVAEIWLMTTKNFNLRDLTTALSGTVCHPRLSLATISLSTKFQVSILQSLEIYERQYKKSKMGWFGVFRESLKVTRNSVVQ